MGLCLDNINKCEGEMFASSKIKGEQFLMRNYIVCQMLYVLFMEIEAG